MAKIDFTGLPSIACNRVLFETLPTPEGRFRYLCRAITPQDTQRLKSLVYASFLKTLYWQILREYKLAESEGKCDLCGSTKIPNVHHKSYQFQGSEHTAMDCLIVLCQGCHSLGHHLNAAKDNEDRITAVIEKLASSHKVIRPRSKANPNYDPRTLMNLKEYGDIRGCRGVDYDVD